MVWGYGFRVWRLGLRVVRERFLYGITNVSGLRVMQCANYQGDFTRFRVWRVSLGNDRGWVKGGLVFKCSGRVGV